MSAMTGQASGLSGTGYKEVKTPNLSPEQMQLFQQLFSGSQGGIGAGLSHLSEQAGGGNEEYWNKLEAPAQRQFGQLQGQIASRFSGMGSGGRKSSGFQNAQSGAATDFAERLQSQRLGLQQNAISQLMGLGQNLLGTNVYETNLIPKKKPFWQELLGSLAGGAGSAVGTFGGYGAGKKIFG